jgi:hypothetical protein
VVVALTVTGLALTACTATSTPPTSSPSTTAKATVADPNTVLNQLATDLRTRIDTLTSGLPATDRRVTGNHANVCHLPNKRDWPKQWHYARGLHLAQPNSRPIARQIAAKLTAQGWAVHSYTDTATELRFAAQKEGSAIDIGAGTANGGMVVLGWTACVDSDGTVDRRPLP